MNSRFITESTYLLDAKWDNLLTARMYIHMYTEIQIHVPNLTQGIGTAAIGSACKQETLSPRATGPIWS